MTLNLRLLDVAFLLKCVEDAAGRYKRQVGHLDADRTSAEIRKILNKEVGVNKELVESALATFKELEGKEGIYPPDDITYKQLAFKLTPRGYQFNWDYGVFEKKGKRNAG